MPNPQPGNSLNMTTANPSKPHSNYNLTKEIAITPRFGVNTPFFSLNVVPDDGPVKIQPNCNTRSYTLKAPSFGKISKHIAFYQVPLQSLLPFNWEKIVKNSQHGTDVQGSESGTNIVPALDGVNTVVSNFAKRLSNRFSDDWTILQQNLSTFVANNNRSSYVSHILHFIVRWEMFFSHGCLLSHLGVHYGHLFRFLVFDSRDIVVNNYSFDGLCQLLLSYIRLMNFSIVDNDGTASISSHNGATHIRRVLDFMRSHSGPFVVSVDDGETTSLTSLPNFTFQNLVPEDSDTEPLNYGMCAAYQIVNAHYYTNDRIDYVYSADIYRQYIGSLIQTILDFDGELLSDYRFTYNGVKTSFDWLSGCYMDYCINATYSYKDSSFWELIFPYFNAIFGFNYSLRYLDYFAGARPRNLAIAGPNTPTNVSVDNNSVQVVNITKGLVAQRFLNAVARVEGNIEDYSEKILGRKPSFDWHNPKYLFSYDMDLFTQEIENTGEPQVTDPNSVTSVFRGSANNLEFTIDIDRHSWIIGIETFDIKRFYFTTQDKNTMAIDRFDMFVPELQYIGDQELKRSELLAGTEKDVPFGYQLRDMQFKQTFPECSGGFVEYLPGWLYKFNPSEFNLRDIERLYISPDFIRSKPTEIDEFYLSLTGMSLASYFHFIEVWTVGVSINRPMIAAPEIL